MADNRIFSDVHLEAEQVTETHRTLNADHTITTEELPGLVNVYLVIDGGKVLLDQLKAPVVLEAIAKQGQAQAQADSEAADAQDVGGQGGEQAQAQSQAQPADTQSQG